MTRKLLFTAFLVLGVSLLFAPSNDSSRALAGPGPGTAAVSGEAGFAQDISDLFLNLIGEEVEDDKDETDPELSVEEQKEFDPEFFACFIDPKLNGKKLCEVCYPPESGEVIEETCLDLDDISDRIRYCESLE